MGKQEPDEEQKRKRAATLIGDFISEREELREGPRFHVPQFVERRIEGTKTVFFMPASAEEVEAPEKPTAGARPAPAAVPEPAAPEPGAVAPKPLVPAQAAPSQPAAVPEPATVATEPAAPAPPPQAEPERQAPFEFPARLMSGQSGPVSFRKPYMKPDTYGFKRPPLEPFPRRPSAKDLIARLRVVKEGVETGEQAFRHPPQEAQAASVEAASREAKMAPPPPASPAAHKELEQKAEGGKLCPSCGSPISDRNRLLICTGCGKMNCDSCNRYELAHMKSDIYYEYQFDFPLCIQCYGKAFSIQRLLGRAGVCYGNGNYSYAIYYANQALEQDPESRYAPKARELIAKTNKAHGEAQERDKEWRLQRKQFATSRLRQEDPSWR
jgi:hypothetical protein